MYLKSITALDIRVRSLTKEVIELRARLVELETVHNILMDRDEKQRKINNALAEHIDEIYKELGSNAMVNIR